MDERKRRSEMGCAAVLFSPILLFGAFALTNGSRDTDTTGNTFWLWVLLLIAASAFTAGSVIWLRNRQSVGFARRQPAARMFENQREVLQWRPQLAQIRFGRYAGHAVSSSHSDKAASMATTINDFAFDYDQFDFAHLLAVLPVARSASLGDMTLTVMSLEIYQAGFAANLLFEQETEPAYPARPDPEGPLLFRGMPAISARDDRGTRYQGRPRAGYGGEGLTRSDMREVCNFAPALDLEARSLTLDVLFVTQLSWNAAGEPQWGTDDIIAGPLHATFILPERI